MKRWLWALGLSVLIHLLLLGAFSHRIRREEPNPPLPAPALRVSLLNAASRTAQEKPIAASRAWGGGQAKKNAPVQPRNIAPEPRTHRPEPAKKPQEPLGTAEPASWGENTSREREDRGEIDSEGASGQGETESAAVDAAEGTAHGTSSGGGVLELHALRVLYKAVPEYPSISRKRLEQGRVTLIVTIQNGNAAGVILEKSSGYARLDQAAQTAVWKWRFDTGLAVVRVRIPIDFTLRK